ncbi:peptidyl-tRNA hydrolase-like protein [Alternaria alternata]|nr:peptidyl-tRNA hydrolase-like protein [Alternaria alternata]
MRLLSIAALARLTTATPLPSTTIPIQCAYLSTTTTLLNGGKSLPPRTPLLDTDLIENFLKGSGPGGQKINKTSSAVQLKHIPTGIVVKYQDTRSREVNRKMARRILQDRIEEMELGEGARTRVKAREKSKKKASSAKKARRKYRKLAEGKEGEEGEGEGVEGVGMADNEEGAELRGEEELVEGGERSKTAGG